MLDLTHTTSLSLWRSECAEKWICGRNRNTSSSHVQCSSRCPDAVFVFWTHCIIAPLTCVQTSAFGR